MTTTITVQGPVGNLAGRDFYNYQPGAALQSTDRVLAFVSAAPPGLTPLRVDVELREIAQALEGSDIALIPVVAARVQDLHAALVQHAPTFLHFAGHSVSEGIVLEDDQGKPFVAGVSFLADMLASTPSVECVVLNACYTAAQAELLAVHVPFVVASAQPIEDPFAVVFAATFYRSLAADVEPGRAFGYACSVAHSRFSQATMPAMYHG